MKFYMYLHESFISKLQCTFISMIKSCGFLILYRIGKNLWWVISEAFPKTILCWRHLRTIIFFHFSVDLLHLLWMLTLMPYKSGISCTYLPKVLFVPRVSVNFPCCASKIGRKYFHLIHKTWDRNIESRSKL